MTNGVPKCHAISRIGGLDIGLNQALRIRSLKLDSLKVKCLWHRDHMQRAYVKVMLLHVMRYTYTYIHRLC
jgi:hypothetical protein